MEEQNRRDFIKYAAGGVIGLGIGGVGYLSASSNNSELQNNIAILETKVKDLDSWILYGGGSNVKYMPNVTTREQDIPMTEVFYFDQNKAICRVDNNREAFIMPTYAMGEVEIEKNSFFMLMEAGELSVTKIIESTKSEDLANTCILTGNTNGNCFTEAEAGGHIYGSRTKPEPFKSEIVAVDGKSFAFTAFFKEDEAPTNYAIFGPKFTFTGELKTGTVTVKRIDEIISNLPKQ